MIAACAHSPVTRPLPTAADPIVQTRTVVRVECPTELRGALPAKPPVPAGARVDANAAGLDWIGQLGRWGDGLFARLTDAAKSCS